MRNVFESQDDNGDLSGLERGVIQPPEELHEPGGHVSYMNDFVYECSECGSDWLTQYWEVETAETELEEWGHRNWRAVPLSPSQLESIKRALRSGTKLRHDEFV